MVVIVFMRRRMQLYPFANGDGLFGHGFGVGNMVLHDRLEELVLILSVKRWLGRAKTQTTLLIIIIIHFI